MTGEERAPAGQPAVSWEAASPTAPPRPQFVSNLDDGEPVRRPRRVVLAFVLTALATLGCIALLLAAALRIDAIQAALTVALPEDVVADYSESDIARAVRVLVGTVAGVWLVLTLVQMLGSLRLLTDRSRVGRVVLIVSTVITIPVAIVAFILRDGGLPGLVATGAVVTAALTATVLVCTAKVSAWLGRRDRPMPRSMIVSGSDERA